MLLFIIDFQYIRVKQLIVKKDKEVVEMTEKEKNNALANKGVKFGCLGFILLVLFVYLFHEPLYPCKCHEISKSIDLDLDHDENYWSRCIDEYGSSTVMYVGCLDDGKWD